jgi:hypothetical protein
VTFVLAAVHNFGRHRKGDRTHPDHSRHETREAYIRAMDPTLPYGMGAKAHSLAGAVHVDVPVP